MKRTVPLEPAAEAVCNQSSQCPRIYQLPPEQGIHTIRNVIFYIHGAGWVFGNFHTHEKLIRELAARTGSLVVFPEYSRSPEAKYPAAIEQCFFLFSSLWSILEPYYPVTDSCFNTPSYCKFAENYYLYRDEMVLLI